MYRLIIESYWFGHEGIIIMTQNLNQFTVIRNIYPSSFPKTSKCHFIPVMQIPVSVASVALVALVQQKGQVQCSH